MINLQKKQSIYYINANKYDSDCNNNNSYSSEPTNINDITMSQQQSRWSTLPQVYMYNDTIINTTIQSQYKTNIRLTNLPIPNYVNKCDKNNLDELFNERTNHNEIPLYSEGNVLKKYHSPKRMRILYSNNVH